MLSAPPLPAATTLSGFGPHRVAVGAFVQITVEVRLNTALFNSLTLQLRVALDGEQQQHSHAEQQPAIITSGSLTPVLPPLAPHSSVRHVFTVCCLAKGQFAFRLQCSSRAAGHQQLLQPETLQAAAGRRQSRFAPLHEAMDRLMADRKRDAAEKGGLTASTQSSDGSSSSVAGQRAAASSSPPFLQFDCPHLLTLDAAV